MWAHIPLLTHLLLETSMRQNRLISLVCTCATASLATSCTSLPAPPYNLAADWHAMTDQYGYVASIGYFTPAQMRDSSWEFARMQSAAGSLCTGFRYAVRRDVQWFKTRRGSGRRCARVVYSFRCTAEEDVGKAIPADALEATRAHIMAEPADGQLENDCGEKDADKIHRPRQTPVVRAPQSPVGDDQQ